MIESIKAAHPGAEGELAYLRLDLADLSTVKATVQEFLARERRLHVLFNNAGVMMPPQGSKTAQGHELQLGTNNLGHHLLTKLLTPILVSTGAASSSPSAAAHGSPPAASAEVRVVWASSPAAEAFSPKPGGVELDNLDYGRRDASSRFKYGVSKAANYLQACELARRLRPHGVVSVAINPGNLDTDLVRHRGRLEQALIRTLVAYPPVLGAYTELFAGLSPAVGLEQSGSWIQPWGRIEPTRQDLIDATKPKSEGGTGIGLEFWEWADAQVKPYL